MGQRARNSLSCLAAAAAFFGAAAIAWADIYEPPASYYSTATATDETLIDQLRVIVSSMTPVTYGDARFSAPITDRDPMNASNVLLIYNRASVSSTWNGTTWNREHIWPDSRLGPGENDPDNNDTGLSTDQFNLRPANPTINGQRANKPFGLDNTSGGHGSQGDHYYPGDTDAGDVARALFYMATRYSTLSLTDATIPATGGTAMGDLSALINYHFKDVPDTFERRRNHAIYGSAGEGSPAITNPYKQSNRNPFVDHPEWVWPIFKPGIGNNSQISIAGTTPGADGGSMRTVDLGRVFVGAAVPAAQNFTLNNLKPDSSWADGTYFEVTTSPAATSSLSGRLNAFRNGVADPKSITVGLNTSTSSPGLKTGSVTINNLDVTTGGGAGRGANDANDVFTINLTVLNHATPSFIGGADDSTWTIDFGSVPLGDPAPSIGFDVFNYATNPSYTALLDFDSFSSTGDSAVLTTDLGNWDGALSIDPGLAHNFMASLSTAAEGDFSATYTLNFSDENIFGALSKSITLTLLGEVEAAILYGDYNGDLVVDAADYTVWRNNLGTSFDLNGSGDENGASAGIVDEADYALWREHYGEVSMPGGGGFASAEVPEPAAVLLAGLALLGFCLHRRR